MLKAAQTCPHLHLHRRNGPSCRVAQVALRRPQNAPGDLFVDATCIDCDTCRWMAPATFARREGMSAVVAQPQDAAERMAALQALVACPTASIGTVARPSDIAAAQASFPIPVVASVSHCGYHSKDSYGATSYFVQRPEGNLLIDCPRFAAPLAKRLEDLGGIARILLTHRDDVADHDRWAKRFGARRMMHEGDAAGLGIEDLVTGDAPVDIVPGLRAIPAPGHTRGHVVYHLDEAGGILFTGDHLAYDDEAGRLEAWPDVCWHDWHAQTASMQRLADLRFEWVLPGHGRRGHLPADAMQKELQRLVGWMEGVGR